MDTQILIMGAYIILVIIGVQILITTMIKVESRPNSFYITINLLTTLPIIMAGQVGYTIHKLYNIPYSITYDRIETNQLFKEYDLSGMNIKHVSKINGRKGQGIFIQHTGFLVTFDDNRTICLSEYNLCDEVMLK